MIVADTSFVLALFNTTDALHQAAAAWERTNRLYLATTPLVVAELDYLLERRGGELARAAFSNDLRCGGYRVEWWADALNETLAVAKAYSELSVGLTDASLVALAARLGTTQIATFDERHFRAMTPLQGGGHFTLLPMDE